MNAIKFWSFLWRRLFSILRCECLSLGNGRCLVICGSGKYFFFANRLIWLQICTHLKHAVPRKNACFCSIWVDWLEIKASGISAQSNFWRIFQLLRLIWALPFLFFAFSFLFPLAIKHYYTLFSCLYCPMRWFMAQLKMMSHSTETPPMSSVWFVKFSPSFFSYFTSLRRSTKQYGKSAEFHRFARISATSVP